MATYPSGKEAAIVLLADPCPSDAIDGSKLAYQKKSESDMRAGYWSFNAKDQPVIAWRDGRVQKLDAAKVRYQPKYVRTTIEKRRPDSAPLAKVPSQVVTAPRADAPSQRR